MRASQDPNGGRIVMNRDRLYGICMQLRGKVKQQWGAMTGDVGAVAAGTRDRLFGGIQERRGISQRESDLQLDDFMRRNGNWRDLATRRRAR
jgi:uncharacterized protein YjbJ (UPF0337 family)